MFLGQAVESGKNVFRVRNWEQWVSKGKGGSRATGRMAAALLGPVCGLQALVRKRLLNLPGGAAAYGVWILLSAIAAETCVPGVFLDDDHTPLTVEDLSLLTDVRREELQIALNTLAGPEVRLIETVALDEVLRETDDVIESPLVTRQPECTPEPANDVDFKAEAVSNQIEPNLCDEPQPAVASTEDDVPRTALSPPPLPTHKPLDKIEKQMAQLAGICEQVDKMKRHVAAMTNSTPILTARRKGRRSVNHGALHCD